LSPNPHALAIYLKFVLICEIAPERFEECQCEDDDVHFHYQTWVPGGCEAQSIPFPRSIEPNT